MEITKQVKLINTSIEEDFTNQRETLEKSYGRFKAAEER